MRRELLSIVGVTLIAAPAFAECYQTKPVVMTVQPGCPYCAAAAVFFRANNIDFNSVSVFDQRYSAYRNWGTPTIFIEGQVVRGFNEGALVRALCR